MATISIKLIAITQMVVLACQMDVTTAKQLIRLQNGSECTEPGYFRDVTDCQRFYYCSTIEDGHVAGLSQSDLVELAKITRNGIKCPDGAIFDEVVGACQNIALVGSVPPECKQPGIREQVYSGLKTGMVADITNNAH